MNIPGVMNRYLLDRIGKNPAKIQRPEGVSDFAGGYIKSEYLAQSNQINPETIYNYKDDLKPLLELLEKYGNLNPNNYTQGSYNKFLEVYNSANKLSEGGYNISKTEIDAAVQKLKDAYNQLKELGSTSDYNALEKLINRAQKIIDNNKYTSQYERELKNVMNSASNLLNSVVSKDKINDMINELSNVIENRINHRKED
jgi:cell fate (sporulation/competence/biofilm development) regulator YlbF (YheA/YmcA/DUF963 family)